MRFWLLGAVIGAGLLSRPGTTGLILVDKYLGDSLYAVMIYLLLGRGPIGWRAVWAMGIVSAIEMFQITGVPARMVADTAPLPRIAGRLLGTVFAWGDLLAYGVGIGVAAGIEALYVHESKGRIGRDLPGHRLD